MKHETRIKIYHVMSIAFLIGALCFSVFRFQAVFWRMIEAIKDLVLSIAYFATDLIFPGLIEPTVATIPEGTIALLPMSWEEFKAAIVRIGQNLIDKHNFFEYLLLVAEILEKIWYLLLPTIVILAFGLFVGWLMYGIPRKKKQKQKKKGKGKAKVQEKGSSDKQGTEKSHTEKKENTKAKAQEKETETKRRKRKETQSNSTFAYRIAYRIGGFLAPVKQFFERYVKIFLKRWKWYRIGLILIWFYNFNIFTIIIETFAFIFYISRSYDFVSIYTQFIKLVLDLSVAADFLPIWAQIILGIRCFHAVRCWLGISRLRGYVKKIAELLDKIHGSIFINGKQRVGKTTLLAVLQIVEAMRQRERAKKRLKARRKQFPHFPWRHLEKTIRRARKKHICYTLATTREFVREILGYFDKSDKYTKEQRRRILKELRKKGYCGDNLIFGYKYKRFRMSYMDGRVVVDIRDCIEQYARTYFIYTTPTSMGYGNFSVRFDEKKKSLGNFEKYNFDFFKRNPKNIKKDSQYSHLAIMDSMRMGKLMDPYNPYKDAIEYGVVAMTEFEKEVGNQNTNGAYKVDAANCNRKNDGLSNFLKTCTHMATVDNETYFRFMCDGHRPGSMAADYAELCTMWRLKKRSESKIILPFFGIEQALCLLVEKGYDWIEDKMSYLQKKRTLFMYLLDTLHSVIFQYYDRIKNKYSMYKLTSDIWDGADQEVLKKGAKIPIPEALAFADRFATDSWGEYWHEKAKRSKYGINDIPQFRTKKMSFDEMMKIGSHIYNEMGELMKLEAFIEARKQRDKLVQELEEKKKQDAKREKESSTPK